MQLFFQRLDPSLQSVDLGTLRHQHFVQRLQKPLLIRDLDLQVREPVVHAVPLKQKARGRDHGLSEFDS